MIVWINKCIYKEKEFNCLKECFGVLRLRHLICKVIATQMIYICYHLTTFAKEYLIGYASEI